MGFGAGEYLPGTGVQLNNGLAEYDYTVHRAPGASVPSMMSPTLAIGERGTLCIGAAGAERIPQALAQVIGLILAGYPLERAVSAPRYVWDGDTLHIESPYGNASLPGIDSGTPPVERWDSLDSYFGTCNAVLASRHGAHGQGDPRRAGGSRTVPAT